MSLSPTPLAIGTINSNALTDFNAIVNLLNAAFPLAAENIASDAVETLKIKNGNVTAAKLAPDAVETLKIKNANVTAEKLASDAVETLKIKDGNVTVGKLSSDSVETIKIKDANVTLAKIANIATSKILGRKSANAGIIEELSAADVLTILGVTRLESHLHQETRNMNAVTGQIEYTGYGFQPTTLIMFYGINPATTAYSVGWSLVSSDGTDKGWSISPGYTGLYGTDHFASFFETGTKYQLSTFNSFTADGFKIDWTRSATVPTSATINMLVLALR